MAILTQKLEVRRYSSRRTFEGVQQLERRWYLLGCCIWSSVLDSEEVPQWAAIQKAALGSTDWRSKFADRPDAVF